MAKTKDEQVAKVTKKEEKLPEGATPELINEQVRQLKEAIAILAKAAELRLKLTDEQHNTLDQLWEQGENYIIKAEVLPFTKYPRRRAK